MLAHPTEKIKEMKHFTFRFVRSEREKLVTTPKAILIK